ncbi:MAG: FlgD immunoglobulin-like domain containing protein [Candidatus Latescibacterota bacterium]|nr:FlgD immunoglobulin-like domain containing protein [Candidatus Latescibacterota bacterium]
MLFSQPCPLRLRLQGLGIALWLAIAATATPVLSQRPEILNLTQLGQFDPVRERRSADFYISGNYAFMGDFDSSRLHVIDISHPGDMHLVAEVDIGQSDVLDVKIAGDLAVLGMQGSSSDAGLAIVDISDPADPELLSVLSRRGWFGVHNLFVYEQHVYLAHSASLGITVVNISDPSDPFIVSHWRHPSFSNAAHDIFISGGIAYVSDFFSGLALVDVSDPTELRIMSSLPSPEGVHSAWRHGDYVYYNQEFGGFVRRLHIADVSDPLDPIRAGSFRPSPIPIAASEGPHNPFVDGDLLYWAYYDSGLRVFDISEPGQPVEIAYHKTPRAWSAQTGADGTIFVADMVGGLFAFSLQRPAWAVREVILAPTELPAGPDAAVSVTAIVEPSSLSASPPPRVTARVYGGEADDPALELERSESDDGGRWRYRGRLLDFDRVPGDYTVRVEAIDADGGRYPLDSQVTVPAEGDLVIFNDGLATTWSATGFGGAEERVASAPVFAGSTALQIRTDPIGSFGWKITFEADAPIDSEPYRGVRLALHPGTLGDGDQLRLTVNAGGPVFIDLLHGDADAMVDLDRDDWQEIELLFEDFEVRGPIEFVRVSGNFTGEFFLDEIRLLEFPPATEDLPIITDDFARGWFAQGELGAVYSFVGIGDAVEGERAVQLRVTPSRDFFNQWFMSFLPPEPIPTRGYQTLRFYLRVPEGNPKQDAILTLAVLSSSPFRRVLQLASGSDRDAVDLRSREWQDVEVVLRDLELQGDIREIQFSGSMEGLLEIDHMHLSVRAAESMTAVLTNAELHDSFSLHRSYPNPFNSTAVIEFDLPADTEADIAVYNIGGQRVRTLSSGFHVAGFHRLQWGGLDDQARPLASGVYFYHLHSPGMRLTGRMTLLR